MQSAELGSRNNPAPVQRLHIPRLGRVLVEAFAADGADDALEIGSLPGRARCAQDFVHPERADLLSKRVPIDPVAVSQQMARRSVPGKGFQELADRIRSRRAKN